VDLDQSDAETLTQLGVAAYAAGQWSDAVSLLDLAAGMSAASPGLEQLYLPMARVNQAMFAPGSAGQKGPFLEQLRADADRIQAVACSPALALDAPWVLGTARFLLGNDTEALAAFRMAPARQAAWRYASAQVEAMVRIGRGGEVGRWLEQLRGDVPEAADLVRLLRAREEVRGLDLEGACGLIGAVAPGVVETVGDADSAAAYQCLVAEVAMCQPKPPAEPPSLSVPEERVSAGVRAWMARLRCRRHLERGEMQAAGELLEQPAQWFAPESEVQRLEAARLALLGINEDMAANTLDHLARLPAAQPLDQLAWGIWLGSRDRHAEAREIFAGVSDALPFAIELRLAWAEAEMAPGGDADHARALLEPLADLAPWTTALRLLPFRPWQRRVPVSQWAQTADVAMTRIADMLHGALLMVRADRIEHAVAVLGMLQQLLGPIRAAGGDAGPLGRRRRGGVGRPLGTVTAVARPPARAPAEWAVPGRPFPPRAPSAGRRQRGFSPGRGTGRALEGGRGGRRSVPGPSRRRGRGPSASPTARSVAASARRGTPDNPRATGHAGRSCGGGRADVRGASDREPLAGGPPLSARGLPRSDGPGRAWGGDLRGTRGGKSESRRCGGAVGIVVGAARPAG